MNGNHAAGATTLSLEYAGTTPGAAESYSLPSTGSFDIDTDSNALTVNKYSYSKSASTYTISPSLANAMPANTPVRFIGVPSSSQTVNKDGNLTLSNTGPFPLRNGTFSVNGVIYAYERKNSGSSRLENVTLSDDINGAFTLAVTTSTDVVCNEFVKLASTGTIFSGSTALETSRAVDYSIPIGFITRLTTSATGEQTETDTMDNLSKWHASTVGSHSIVNDGGNNVMQAQAQDVSSIFGLGWSGQHWSLITQNQVNFISESAWSLDHLLDYDAQVKTDTNGNDEYHMGLSFRIQNPPSGNDVYLYGLSFSRNEGSLTDIPTSLIPPGMTDVPLILLWQRTSSGFDWVAYKTLGHKIVCADASSISEGDRIRGKTTHAIADVLKKNGNTLLIGDISGTFSAGETLQTGTWRLFLGWRYTDRTTIVSYQYDPMMQANGLQPVDYASLLVRIDEEYVSGTSGPKYNDIRCYYGKVGQEGTPNTVPTDNNRASNPIWTSGSPAPLWPPDNVADWSASNDKYTLINWDSRNTSADGYDNSSTGTGVESGCLVRSAAITSPDTADSTAWTSEVGVHSAGASWVWFSLVGDTVRFDDFAIRYIGAGSSANYGFLKPIQE
jgi:hypothetical protein